MASSPVSRERIDPALLKLGLAMVLGVIMSLLDTTIVNVAIETLSRQLHSPISTVQWVTTGYLLALAVVLPLTGWATDRFGPKRLFIGSIVVFTIASAACGLAPNVGALIAFRVLQGAGGAFILPVAQAVIAGAAGPQRMGRMMSLIGIPAMLAPVFGPALGGLIIDNLSWRWIFFVNLPIGVAAVICCRRVLPVDRPEPSEHLDRLGIVLLCPGLALIVYGLSNAGTTGSFVAPSVLGWFLAGVALLAGFVGHSLRLGDRALVPIRYLSDRAFAAGSAATFVMGAALFGAMILLPLYYQQVRGESPLSAGLLLAPQGIGSAAAMVLAGSLTDRIGPRRVVVFGMAVMLAGTAALTQVGPHSSYVLLSGSLFVRGIGLGASMMPTMAAAYQTLGPRAVGRATTALNIFQRVGGSIGTALVTVVLANQFAAHAQTPAGAAASYGDAFWAVMAITAIGLVASWWLPARPPAPAGAGDAARPSLVES